MSFQAIRIPEITSRITPDIISILAPGRCRILNKDPVSRHVIPRISTAKMCFTFIVKRCCGKGAKGK